MCFVHIYRGFGAGMSTLMQADNEREHDGIRQTVNRFAAQRAPMSSVRKLLDSDEGYDAELWRQMTQELGVQALIVPENYGGLGLGFTELAIALEEFGAALTPSPLYSTACATTALLLAGSDEQRAEWLPLVADGSCTGTVAFAEQRSGWDLPSVTTTFRESSEGYTLSGAKCYVVDGATADFLVVVARATDSTGSAGLGLFLVRGEDAGLRRSPLRTMDGTRAQAELVLENVPAERLAADLDAVETIALIAARCAVLLCAEMVGGTQRCLDMAVGYAKIRVQFGRVIGGFQAIKHKAADMLVAAESARAALHLATSAADSGDEQFPLLADLAKATCSEAYFRNAAENIQIHGGIGFTWEHDAHLYFKRAKSSEVMWGDADYHREQLSRKLELA